MDTECIKTHDLRRRRRSNLWSIREYKLDIKELTCLERINAIEQKIELLRVKNWNIELAIEAIELQEILSKPLDFSKVI